MDTPHEYPEKYYVGLWARNSRWRIEGFDQREYKILYLWGTASSSLREASILPDSCATGEDIFPFHKISGPSIRLHQ
jgi:hypothetical protein